MASSHNQASLVALYGRPEDTQPVDLDGVALRDELDHGARTALFPLYPAALSLAEVQITTRGDTRSPAPHNAASALIPPRRSKHYLPTTRTPLKCPFLGAFLMVLLNRNASNRQFKRKCPSHYGRFPFNQNRIRRVSEYKAKCKI